MTEQHYRITIDELINHYRDGDVTAKGALRIYFRVRLAQGWKCRVKPSEIQGLFSKWSDKKGGMAPMARSTFWDAMYKLQEEKEIDFKEPDSLVVTLLQPLSNKPDERPINRTSVQETGQESRILNERELEALQEAGSETSSYSSQISFNSLSLEREEISENPQELETGSNSSETPVTTDLITQPVQDPIASFKNSEAALTNAATATARHELLEYDGENTPWLNPPRRRGDIYFKPEFMQWQGSRWMQKFSKRDIYEAIADFRASLINEPDRIPGRWEEYEQHMNHAVRTAKTHIDSGYEVPAELQQKLITHLPAVYGGVDKAIEISGGEIPSISAAVDEGHSENAGAYRVYKASEDDELPMDAESIANRARLLQMTREQLFNKRQAPKAENMTGRSATPQNLAEARAMIHDPILRNEVIRWANRSGYEVDLESLEILEL